MSKPTVSVIIPTYNRREFVLAAVESVLNQKNPGCSYELIVVDDGSTDDTEQILAIYKDKIRYFKIKHSGLPAIARNFGVSKARGELIAFQDSDDLWPEDRLAKQLPVFRDRSINMSYGQAKTINAEGKQTNKNFVEPNKLIGGEKFESLAKENVISTLTVMLRKDIFTELGGFNEDKSLKAIEDYELWLRLATKYPGSIRSLSTTLAYYRMHDANISAANTLLAIERLVNVYDRVWEGAVLSNDDRNSLEAQMAVMHENWSRQQNIEGNTPAISVVMSMYNTQRYLREAVDSILKQTYKDFEFIIIDDGSSDKSAEIIKSYKDERIRLVYQNNHGLVFSFNKGVRLARAKYIARMDSDDVSLPSRFKKELDWLEASDVRGLVGTYFSYVDEKTKKTSVTLVWPTKHTDLKRTMYYVNPFGHGTVMMRREAVVGVGGYRPAYEPAEDSDLWARIARHWEVGQIAEVLYLWRFHPASISRRKSEVSNRAAARIAKEMWDQPLVDKPIWAILKDAFYYRRMDSPYSQRVAQEYRDNQSRLAAEFLVHGKLWIGYRTAFAAFLLNPGLTMSYWETFLRAPIKYIRDRR